MPGNKISAISVHKQQRYRVSHLTFRDPLDVPPTVLLLKKVPDDMTQKKQNRIGESGFS